MLAHYFNKCTTLIQGVNNRRSCMQGVERLEWDAYVGLVLPAQFFCKSETVPQKNKVYYFF